MTVDGSASPATEFILSGETIIDTPNGVMEGLKYHPNQGEHVGAVIKTGAGAQPAVFISATSPNASVS